MRPVVVVLALSLACLGAASPPTVSVAAAADLQVVLPDVIKAFAQVHPGFDVRVSYGASGTFYAQLLQQAPYDLFLSADVAYPHQLAAKGLGAPASEFVYAVGRLVVWIPNASKVDVEHKGVQALADPAVRKLAIANPAHAPYGRAAAAALRHFGMYAALAPRLVFGENIAQAAQFAESGAADAAIIAMALALSPALQAKGRYAEVPDDAYPRLEQGGIIMTGAKAAAAAGLLRDFLRGATAQALFAAHGYHPPSS